MTRWSDIYDGDDDGDGDNDGDGDWLSLLYLSGRRWCQSSFMALQLSTSSLCGEDDFDDNHDHGQKRDFTLVQTHNYILSGLAKHQNSRTCYSSPGQEPKLLQTPTEPYNAPE